MRCLLSCCGKADDGSVQDDLTSAPTQSEYAVKDASSGDVVILSRYTVNIQLFLSQHVIIIKSIYSDCQELSHLKRPGILQLFASENEATVPHTSL